MALSISHLYSFTLRSLCLKKPFCIKGASGKLSGRLSIALKTTSFPVFGLVSAIIKISSKEAISSSRNISSSFKNSLTRILKLLKPIDDITNVSFSNLFGTKSINLPSTLLTEPIVEFSI